MSANDKFGLGYGDHIYDGILSYENEVLQSVFMNKESELEKQPLYDKFVTAGGMHDVPPPMTGNYMPSRPDIEVWLKAPIIEEYESESEDEKMARKAELNKKLGGTEKASEWEISKLGTMCKEVNKQNNLLLPHQVLTRTGKIPVNTAKASGTKNVNTARQSFNRQAVLTSTAMKVNTVKPIVNKHMNWKRKADLAEFQDLLVGPVAWGGSRIKLTNMQVNKKLITMQGAVVTSQTVETFVMFVLFHTSMFKSKGEIVIRTSSIGYLTCFMSQNDPRRILQEHVKMKAGCDAMQEVIAAIRSAKFGYLLAFDLLERKDIGTKGVYRNMIGGDWSCYQKLNTVFII
ncbi:hypothetical protein Tco_0291599 [Tanacetum coccineum]